MNPQGQKCWVREGSDELVNVDDFWGCGGVDCAEGPVETKIQLHSMRYHATCLKCGTSRFRVRPILHIMCIGFVGQIGSARRCGWVNPIGQSYCLNEKCGTRLLVPLEMRLSPKVLLIKYHKELGGRWVCTRCISLAGADQTTCGNQDCKGTLEADGVRVIGDWDLVG